jgi:hypothetical protein
MASGRMMSLILVLAISTISKADSIFFAPEPGYQANDILTTVYFNNGYDAYGSNVIGWAGGSLKIYGKNGTLTNDFGGPPGYSNSNCWNSFVKLDPSGDSAWVGFTVSGNTDDRIYQIDLTSGTWNHIATMAGNFEIEFSGGNPFVSGLNSTNWSAPSSIWLLDVSGGNNHDLIASIGGYSAGLGFDDLGNLYYATNGISGGNILIQYTATQIANAIGTESLSLSEATKLSDIDGGAYDTDVDDAGNVLYNTNGGAVIPSYTAVWNGNTGGGTNYDLIGTGKGEWGDWFSFMDTEGDVTASGSLYQADFYFNGVAEVTVPEPATMVLLALGGLLISKREKS